VKPRRTACTIAIFILLAGCGPSAQQIATMTAAAWTPTPAPTPTATPIPYDLTVHIADEGGAPLTGASVVLLESGSDQPIQIDASGQYTWTNLQGPEANLSVSAPGYHPAVQPVTLERGSTEMALILQRDPLGLLAADACAPDEKLLYLEDFQSGQAAGWRLTSGDPAAWSIVSQDDGNEVASISGIGGTQVELSALVLDNAVWRLKVQATGADGDSFLNLKHFRAGGDTRYIVQWGVNPFLAVTRFDGGIGETVLGLGGFQAKPGKWNYIEVSNYQGLIQVWVNGQKQIEAQDPVPLAAGTISVEGHISTDPTTAYYFDDISVCELSAPFATSMYKPPAQ